MLATNNRCFPTVQDDATPEHGHHLHAISVVASPFQQRGLTVIKLLHLSWWALKLDFMTKFPVSALKAPALLICEMGDWRQAAIAHLQSLTLED